MSRYILEFGAPWCAPCRNLEPHLANAQVNVIKINVDSGDPRVKQYNIQSVPTVLFMEGPKVLDMCTGATQAVIDKIKTFK